MTTYEIEQIQKAFIDTLYLLLITGIFLTVIGLMLGFLLYFTRPDERKDKPKMVHVIHFVLGGVIDISRSIPFIILMIMLIPVTVIIMGTMLGRDAALPALVISASPFYARVVFNALKDIPHGTHEALESMGASKRVITRTLLKEALPSLISGLTVAMVSLVGFIAAAGAVGAGGLGDLARRRALVMDYDVMYVAVGLLLVIVLVIQFLGDFISKKVDHR